MFRATFNGHSLLLTTQYRSFPIFILSDNIFFHFFQLIVKFCCYTSNWNAVSIGRERVTWRTSKLHDSLRRTKFTNSLGQQQFEQDERSYEHFAFQSRFSCSPAAVKTKEQISSVILIRPCSFPKGEYSFCLLAKSRKVYGGSLSVVVVQSLIFTSACWLQVAGFWHYLSFKMPRFSATFFPEPNTLCHHSTDKRKWNVLMKSSEVNSRQFLLYTGDGASLPSHFIEFNFRIDLQTVYQNKLLLFLQLKFNLTQRRIKIIS